MKQIHLKLSILFFLQFVVWGAWYVTLGTYLLETLRFDGRQVGLIYGATAIAATVSPFILGNIADRLMAAEKLMSILHLVSGVVMFFTASLDEFRWFYPAIIAYSLLYIPTFALASSVSFYHLKNATTDFPKVRVWGTIGWILIGIVISYYRLETTATPMHISGASSFLLGAFCLFLPPTPPQPQVGKKSISDLIGKEVLALFQKKSFTVLILAMVLIAIPSGYYYSFTNAFLTDIGISGAAAKMSIGQGSEIIIMLLLPLFFKRMSFKWIITIGLLMWGLRYGLFAYGNANENLWMIYIGIVVHGIAYTFTFLTAQIYVDKIAPPSSKGAAQGFIALVTMGFGALMGAYIAGETVQYFTLFDGFRAWQSIWSIPCVIGIVVALGFMIFFKKEKTSNSI